MSEKRYFKIEYDEEWYLFDSTTISEQLVKEQAAEYDYGVFANSLSPSEICGRLNTLHQENQELKERNAHNFAKKIELTKENERLRTQLLICQQSKNDDLRL